MGKQPARKGLLTEFLSGPYFKTIPISHAAQKLSHHRSLKQVDESKQEGEEEESYDQTIKRLALEQQDTDGHYGFRDDELVPLPFDTPKSYEYLIDILSGTFLVAQATIVMFIAIWIENSDRVYKDSAQYRKHWLPLIQALIILYPLVTLIVMVNLIVEYTVRKFMYYRLLSMRILVDWANVQVWQGWFFYYFIATWILMNIWAIYGLVAYRNIYNEGTDSGSTAVFIVVNLQTVQLFLQYIRLIYAESRLVSLNQIFERAPVEAQRLLTYTYVIEEADLREECKLFVRKTRSALSKRFLHIMTCGYLHKDWRQETGDVKFDVERLKSKSPNLKEVDAAVMNLRRDLIAANYTPPTQASRDGVAVNMPPVEQEMDEKPADGQNRQAATFAATPVSRWNYWYCCGVDPLDVLYDKLYATSHSLVISLLPSFGSWPYRPDVKYFRALTVLQFLGVMGVGLIVLIGILLSTQDSVCKDGLKQCKQCDTFIRGRVGIDGLCHNYSGLKAAADSLLNHLMQYAGLLQK